MKMNVLFKEEEGFWSVFVLLLLVTLALMGMGAYTVMRSEGKEFAANLNMLQTDYSASGATYFALRALRIGTLTDQTITIGNATATIDTAWGSYTWNGTTYNTRITILSQKGDAQKSVQLLLNTRMPLKRLASWSGGAASNITTRDSLGFTNSKLLIQNTGTSMPPINATSLNTLSTAQAHNQGAANWSPANNYPSASFYNAGTTPNVTHVSGNLNLASSRTIYGIYVVEGTVTIGSGSQIIGVIYCPNSTNITISSSPATNSVTGGIICRGAVSGSSTSYIKNNMTYMTVLSRYTTAQDTCIIGTPGAWTYQ